MTTSVKCDLCSSAGLHFQATHIDPIGYIEGPLQAKIWIVGLNPKGEIGTLETRTKQEFESFNPDRSSYFRDFKKVSERLYKNWLSEKSTVAHTDLVKCYSPTFPPNDDNKSKQLVIGNCKRYLFNQILLHKPKVLICNGTDVCNMMMSFFPPNSQEPHTLLTSYKASFQSHAFTLVLSGFIGRIDDRNKRRLGKEIEAILQEENIQL
jgi:uracil-DNA glycosylase